MRIRSVKELKGGEILSEPVVTEEKEVLIPEGTTIREDYIPLIQSMGIETLMIEDPYVHYENPHLILHPDQYCGYVEKIRKLLEGHIYRQTTSLRLIQPLANDIVKDMAQMTDHTVIDVCERTADLYEHTIMVTLLSLLLAKRMKISEDLLLSIAIGGLLHDLGIRYITAPYEDCNLDELTPNEIFEFKKHPILGYTAIEEEKWIPDVSRNIILYHHERMDGSGFPLKQNSFEVSCRIVQLCDAFDSYISGVECRRISIQEALEKIKSQAGILFDGEMVREFISLIAKYPVGTTVKTSEEENGVVISQTDDPDHPIIMFLDANMCCKDGEKQLNLEKEKNVSIRQVV